MEVLRRADGDEVDEGGMRGSSDFVECFADVFLHLCVCETVADIAGWRRKSTV
jgi:hypothetical protein